MDGPREGGPEEDGCYRLEDMCTQKRRLEDGREGGQGATGTVEPCSSSSSSSSYTYAKARKKTTPGNTFCIFSQQGNLLYF